MMRVLLDYYVIGIYVSLFSYIIVFTVFSSNYIMRPIEALNTVWQQESYIEIMYRISVRRNHMFIALIGVEFRSGFETCSCTLLLVYKAYTSVFERINTEIS